MLKVTDVSIDIAGKRIVDNVSFAERTGTVTGLIGPNGAGHPTFWC
ncbi:hypothetical protein [Corynebacterium stationis]|nr:hypothetical protein [Corynebacterium stationis]